MAGNYTEVYTECPKCGYSYSRAEQVECPHRFRDKLSRQLAGQEKVMEDNELLLTEIAKLLYFIRTSTSKYPEGSNWDKCQNKRLWLSNAEMVIAKVLNRDRPKVCPECIEGMIYDKSGTPEYCPTCQGTGEVDRPDREKIKLYSTGACIYQGGNYPCPIDFETNDEVCLDCLLALFPDEKEIREHYEQLCEDCGHIYFTNAVELAKRETLKEVFTRLDKCHPYKLDIFPTTTKEARALFDKKGLSEREITAISGCICRVGYEAAISNIKDLLD